MIMARGFWRWLALCTGGRRVFRPSEGRKGEREGREFRLHTLRRLRG